MLKTIARLVALQNASCQDLDFCSATQQLILAELNQEYCMIYLLEGDQLRLICPQPTAAEILDVPRAVQEILQNDDLTCEIFQRARRHEEIVATSRVLPGLGWFHVLPVKAENELLGILVTGARSTLPNSVVQQRQTLEEILHILAHLLLNRRLQREAERRQVQVMRDLAHSKDVAELTHTAKSLFLGNMSHEIRTPMNGIIGVAQLMSTTRLDLEQREFMRVIQTSCNALLRIVDGVLDFSKIEAGTIELEQVPFDIHQTITDFVTSLRTQLRSATNEETIVVSCSIPDDFPRYLLGDPVRIGQIVSNLCSNAVKFTHQGSINIGLGTNLRELAGPTPADQTIHFTLSVEDSGIGIEQSQLKSIFQEFKQADSSITRKYGGTGLGLSIVKALTELMGGIIRVDSTPGKGSTFHVDLALPIVEGPMEGQVEAPAFNRASFQGNALLVEDDEANRMVASRLLEKMGWQVTQVANGHRALMSMKQNEFDLVIMDCQMPVMDGFETSRRIRHELGMKTIPIIALTADASKDTEFRCKLSGMNAFLTKPVNKDLLHSTIRQQRTAQ